MIVLESIARGDVRLLLLDEPYAGLDSAAEDRATAIINACQRRGAACMVADHTKVARDALGATKEYALNAVDDMPAPFLLSE